jgi:hypothetical protein
MAKWQHEIDQAIEDEDKDRLAMAHQALTRAEQQRHRQLACRADPNQPPF